MIDQENNCTAIELARVKIKNPSAQQAMMAHGVVFSCIMSIVIFRNVLACLKGMRFRECLKGMRLKGMRLKGMRLKGMRLKGMRFRECLHGGGPAFLSVRLALARGLGFTPRLHEKSQPSYRASSFSRVTWANYIYFPTKPGIRYLGTSFHFITYT